MGRAQISLTGDEGPTPVDELIPTVVRRTPRGEQALDLYSALAVEERIVFVNGPITSEMAERVTAQILWLDREDHAKPINLYINSPGGSVTAGMAIHDLMKYVRAPVHTFATGMAASMAAVLLAAGDQRFALPNARIMIHQPSQSGIGGQETDVHITSQQLTYTREDLERLLACYCQKPYRTVHRDCERDDWKTPYEAVAYGIVDDVLVSAAKPPSKRIAPARRSFGAATPAHRTRATPRDRRPPLRTVAALGGDA